jgi:hypothetical protein
LAIFRWLPRQRARIEHIDAEAEALIGCFGIGAYSEARRRELEASSDAIAAGWGRVALAIARKAEGPARMPNPAPPQSTAKSRAKRTMVLLRSLLVRSVP